QFNSGGQPTGCVRDVSSVPGEFLFREFDEPIGFCLTLAEHLVLNDERHYRIHANQGLLRHQIYQIIAGYDGDDAADQLTNDPVLTQIIGKKALASQPSLSRFLDRFDADSIGQLNQANRELLDRLHRYRESDALILDLDSTHADPYGDQEAANYNTHYGTVGFHPRVA